MIDRGSGRKMFAEESTVGCADLGAPLLTQPVPWSQIGGTGALGEPGGEGLQIGECRLKPGAGASVHVASRASDRL